MFFIISVIVIVTFSTNASRDVGTTSIAFRTLLISLSATPAIRLMLFFARLASTPRCHAHRRCRCLSHGRYVSMPPHLISSISADFVTPVCLFRHFRLLCFAAFERPILLSLVFHRRHMRHRDASRDFAYAAFRYASHAAVSSTLFTPLRLIAVIVSFSRGYCRSPSPRHYHHAASTLPYVTPACHIMPPLSRITISAGFTARYASTFSTVAITLPLDFIHAIGVFSQETHQFVSVIDIAITSFHDTSWQDIEHFFLFTTSLPEFRYCSHSSLMPSSVTPLFQVVASILRDTPSSSSLPTIHAGITPASLRSISTIPMPPLSSRQYSDHIAAVSAKRFSLLPPVVTLLIACNERLFRLQRHATPRTSPPTLPSPSGHDRFHAWQRHQSAVIIVNDGSSFSACRRRSTDFTPSLCTPSHAADLQMSIAIILREDHQPLFATGGVPPSFLHVTTAHTACFHFA